jgi:hypothetical protein
MLHGSRLVAHFAEGAFRDPARLCWTAIKTGDFADYDLVREHNSSSEDRCFTLRT